MEIITKEEAVNSMLRSGYLLESRVSALLRQLGWIVESNSAYLDPNTGKSRELDIHAIGGATVYRDERGLSQVFQHLFIECVNTSQPIVLIKSDGLLNERKAELIKVISDPAVIWDEKYCHQWSSFLRLHEFHHYVTAPLATQFCSFTRKGTNKEWMASHEDGQYASFVSLGQAVRFHLLAQGGGRRKSARRDGVVFPPHAELFYPLFVVQGELWSIDQTQDAPAPQAVERINYKHSAFVNGVFEEYIVSVITESHLPEFLNKLQIECETIAERIRENITAIEAAQTRIVDMPDQEFSRLSVARSPHLARIVAANIVSREILEQEKKTIASVGSKDD